MTSISPSGRDTDHEIEIRRYGSEDRVAWDAFVYEAKNGHFMLTRGYMDHHGDTFLDASMMFYRKNRLIAVMPAHVDDGVLWSHRGLSFAGVISHRRMRTSWMLDLFERLRARLVEDGLQALMYKTVPWPYQDYPAEEDLYALYLMGATCEDMKVTYALRPSHFAGVHETARNLRNRAVRAGVTVRLTNELATFFEIHRQMHEERHMAEPLHSYEELAELTERFPEHILLYGAFEEETMIGGLMVFVDRTTVRMQKMGLTSRGRELYVQSLLVDALMREADFQDRWIDFGTSMDPSTGGLQHPVAFFKETLGGAAIVTRTFRLEASAD